MWVRHSSKHRVVGPLPSPLIFPSIWRSGSFCPSVHRFPLAPHVGLSIGDPEHDTV